MRQLGETMRRRHWVVLLSVAATAAAVTGTAAAVAASAAAVADEPSSLVEDYRYPGADTILTQRGIKLIKGDGHIMLADCGANPDAPPADLILVQSLKPDFPAGPNFCFKATGTVGYLTMEIPDAYFVRGDSGRTLAAKVETHDNPAVVETEKVEPGEWQPVGVGQSRGSATILELRYPFGS
jgi:hypothetical protein